MLCLDSIIFFWLASIFSSHSPHLQMIASKKISFYFILLISSFLAVELCSCTGGELFDLGEFIGCLHDVLCAYFTLQDEFLGPSCDVLL